MTDTQGPQSNHSNDRPADPAETEEYSYSSDSQQDDFVDFLDDAFQARAGSAQHETDDLPKAGSDVGRYRLKQKIGQGGMGVVFLAEQTEPVTRQVALKLIRLRANQNAEQVAARFEAERQAVAMMNHPNICRLLDAGTHDGCPYFVMELVKGVPITRFCDEAKLTITERLKLFLPVCAAVQHAHQMGIIHRDLKPSNILVAAYDGKPVPKIIDFGLAKSLEAEHRLTDRSMFTEFGSVVGTLQYMSPEQAEFNELPVDTRTDIYALGVVLYELLTGSTPIDNETLRQHAFLQVLKLIQEQDPVCPSARISDSHDAAPGISTQRQAGGPGRLQQILRGELDWIVMRAIERDRTRRYDSVGLLSEDVSRYLANEPVLARPPGRLYLLRKFISRNWRSLTAGLATLVAIIAGAFWIQQENHNRVTLFNAESRAARADYRSAVGFWNSNRVGLFEEQLNRVPKAHRHIEWRLASHSDTGHTFRGHEHAVFAVAISSDQESVATAGATSSIEIWDPDTLKSLISIPHPHTNETIRALAFHPQDDTTLVSVGDDGFMCVWNTVTGERKRAVRIHESRIHDLAFNSDGTKVALGGGTKIEDRSPTAMGWMSVRDFKTGEELVHQERPGHSCINCVAFSPDDSHVLTGSLDLIVRVWDAQSGTQLMAGQMTSYIWDVAWHPAGRYFAACTEDNSVSVLDVQEGRLLWRRPGPSKAIYCLQFSPDGQRLASGSFDGSVQLWHPLSGEKIRILRGHTAGVHDLAFSADSNRIVSAGTSPDNTVRVRDLTRGPENAGIDAHTQSVNALAYSGDSQLLASASGTHEWDPYPGRPGIVTDNSVRIWNTRTAEPEDELTEHLAPVADVIFDPSTSDGSRVISADRSGLILLWDRNQETTQPMDAAAEVCAVWCSEDGRHLTSVGSGGEVINWDLASRSVASRITLPSDSRLLCVEGNADARLMAVGSDTGELTLINSVNSRILWTEENLDAIYSVAFSPDGRFVYSGNGTHGLSIHDITDGTIIRSLRHHYFAVYSINLHAEAGATRMLTGSHDGDWKLWDTDGMEELRSVRPYSTLKWNHIFDAKIRPDGQQIAIGGSDGRIRFWDCSSTDR